MPILPQKHLRRLLQRFLLGVCCFTAVPLLLAASVAKRTYDVPAGAADQALKHFSEQSGRGLLITSDVARGVRTHPIKGEYTAREAIDLMLTGTDLVASED